MLQNPLTVTEPRNSASVLFGQRWDKMAESTVKGLVAEDRPTIVSAPEYPTRRGAFVLRQI